MDQIDLISQQQILTIKIMGECYSKQANQPSLRTTIGPQPQKCIMIQNPSSLVLQLSDGSVETVAIGTKSRGQELVMRVQPGLFFGKNNQVYLIVKSNGLNDRNFMQAVHAYHQISRNANGIIQPDYINLIKHKDKYYLFVKSKPLGDKSVKFVDLVDLGKKMREKQICWQDLQFNSIVTQVIKKYACITKKDLTISNIIIGNNGSIHLLSLIHPNSSTTPSTTLQHLLLQSLYGKKITKTQIPQLQLQSQFKHKESLAQIEGINYLIQEEKKIKSKCSLISNPSLKFIRDYITAYHYKLQCFNLELLDAFVVLGQYEGALGMLDQYMVARGYYDTINQQTYQFYLRLLQIHLSMSPKSLQTTSAKKRVCSAANHLAKLFKMTNKYTQSLYYYNDCLVYQTTKLQDSLYLEMAEVCRALNRNIQAQSTLLQGLAQHPNSKLLHLQLIVYICDCMRIDQAQKQLFKATPSFRTIQMSVGTAKILLAKGILNQQKRAQFLKKAKQQLQQVVVDQYQKQKDNNLYSMALYHETLGDCYFQQHNFASAKQEYHISKIMLKNQKASGYRLANITAAQGNCLMMEGIYDEAIKIYNEALSYISGECKTLMDSISGNIGIAKIKKGLVEEGKKQIKNILNSTPAVIVQKDYNYTFFKNVLAALQNSKPQ